MEKHQSKKLTFEFPAEEFIYLKMTCAKKGVSMKDFVTNAVIKSIGEYEEQLDSLTYKAVTDEEKANARPWEEVQKELGWDKF